MSLWVEIILTLSYLVLALATYAWLDEYNPPGRGWSVERISAVVLCVLWPCLWLFVLGVSLLWWLRPLPNPNNKEVTHG